ncbi:hypothetical protein M409DRAFT_20031 [Zasmidium cellare ATCC 36951]|uniref:AA1-like domain-containing protein n=1 Tax=Zasmidium cellare ATCC 36951 TaxID=1080233 RepID=A0A6A6CQP4_ZASCE|nr:uncharacterized protein M409DRAFT_20031 [Zasmidium cellare ATCC 36951]KAF2169617.1 hypothetical protein M409DRAFT_20031 [Zasmidium cellare ATCC 36951]
MRFSTLLTALLASASTSLAFPTPPDEDLSLTNTTLTGPTPRGDRSEEDRKWDKKKIVIWTYTKDGNSCAGHAAQSKHKLKPFKCKNFGWFDRFSEVQFELPKEVHKEGVNCELTFYDGDGCKEGRETGKVQNEDERPECQNEVGNMIEKRSCMPRCWKD